LFRSFFLLFHKPKGISSFKCISIVRKITGLRKIGHAGTLDPLASGLLIIGIRKKATQNLSYFQNLPKTYLAEITLGIETDSYDREGKIVYRHPHPINISKTKIIKTLKNFEGIQQQKPPIFSAIKINGLSHDL